MFFKRNKSQKEIISQLKKENAQLRAENDQLAKLYVEKDEILLAKQKLADEERKIFEKRNAELKSIIAETREKKQEFEENIKRVKEFKACYEKATEELREALKVVSV